MKILQLLFLSFGFVGLLVGISGSFQRSEFSKLLALMPSDGPAAHYGNVVMRSRSSKKDMAPVTFPHWNHRTKYSCQVCHVELEFSMYKGESNITRGGNLAGRYCGACHNGEIAFSVRSGKDKACDRCHIKKTKALDSKFREFAEKMPKTKYGNRIDWVKALDKGLIKLKNSLYDDNSSLKLPRKLRKPLKLGTNSPRSMVVFSHKKHVAWLDCSICHPQIFNIKKKGTQSFSMDKNMYGWFCGSCHLQVAFPMNDCNRCHPKMKSGIRVRAF